MATFGSISARYSQTFSSFSLFSHFSLYLSIFTLFSVQSDEDYQPSLFSLYPSVAPLFTLFTLFCFKHRGGHTVFLCRKQPALLRTQLHFCEAQWTKFSKMYFRSCHRSSQISLSLSPLVQCYGDVELTAMFVVMLTAMAKRKKCYTG